MSKMGDIVRIFFIVLFIAPSNVLADNEAELAKKLANPVASLISVPFQYNYDNDYGVNDDGTKQFVNVQPVIPISISESTNVISRTILPIAANDDLPSGSNKAGVGDVLQSFFISPKEPSSNGLIWGVGPAFLLSTASDETLGGEKWAAGPTFVGLKQDGHWTYGLLTNHLLSFAGVSYRKDINATFIQPFVSYITDTKTTITLNTESTYDWEDDESSVPINLTINQLLKIGNQPIQIGIGPRYWVESPDAGPEGWGARAVFTLLFPK